MIRRSRGKAETQAPAVVCERVSPVGGAGREAPGRSSPWAVGRKLPYTLAVWEGAASPALQEKAAHRVPGAQLTPRVGLVGTPGGCVGHRVGWEGAREGIPARHHLPAPAVRRAGLPQFFMEVTEAVSGVDVGRLEVEDRDLPGSPNWVARFTILDGDPNGQFAIRTDPKTNEGVLSVVKVSGVRGSPRWGLAAGPQHGGGGGCLGHPPERAECWGSRERWGSRLRPR